MSWNNLNRFKRGRMANKRRIPDASRRSAFRPTVEQLEDRALPSTFYAATVSDLIADIKAANTAGGSNTIVLTAPTTSPYVLTAVDNSSDGGNGLPVIAANDNLTVLGNSDVIERNPASGTAAFRLFDVAVGASLTLQSLTLQGGLAAGPSNSPSGGAIYSYGNLTLNGVTVQNNEAVGGLVISPNGLANFGALAFGGGVYVAGGSAILTNVTLSSNIAQGAPGVFESFGCPLCFFASRGGNAYGGGLYVGGGTVSLSNVIVSGNIARGGDGGNFGGSSIGGPPVRGTNGGSAYGGGLYVNAGSVSLTNVGVSSNTAQGGNGAAGANGGSGFGGGLDVGGGTVSMVHDTVTNNAALGGQGGKGAGGKNGFPSGDAGTAAGGGIYIATGASLTLDAFTLANVNHNKPDDIFGSYTVSP